MSVDNNPLKQYFRKPAIYLKLPSGGNYPQGIIEMSDSGELPVFPMTALDEIAIKTPDALFNGEAVAEIIKSCVPNIKDPWKINSTDLNAILIAIKSASGGNDMEVGTSCPSCNEVSQYTVSLVSLLSQLRPGNYTEELKINDLLFKFRPLTYKEMNEIGIGQFELQRVFSIIEKTENLEEKNKKSKEALISVTNMTISVLSKTIEYIKTPNSFVDNKDYILDFLKNCDKSVYEKIRDYNGQLREQTEIKPLKIKCVHCNHEYDQPLVLNMSDFFD